MNIVDVNGLLEEHTLSLVPLTALCPNPEPYTALLLQPEGYLEANARRVGHADQEEGAQLCTQYLECARSRHADLVVTPEYCVPWSVIGSIASGELTPPAGSLWVLGCESITPEELNEFRCSMPVQNPHVRVLHEEVDSREMLQRTFLDPLVYVFWTKADDDAKVLCLLVQFKTQACRDEGHIELTALCRGRTVYKFGGGVNEIGLMGIICSDAFNFDPTLVDEHHANTLIVHVQLNPKPAHADYAAYRSHLFSVGANSNTGLLCLNWARDVTDVEEGQERCWNNVAASCWYLPWDKCALNDDDFDALHAEGVYHCVVARLWHAFFLNYAPHAVLLRMPKLLVRGPQVLNQKIAPAAIERWRCDRRGKALVPETADDGFKTLLSDYPELQAHLPAVCARSPIAVERALELLEGPSGKPDSWFEIKELDAVHVGVGEVIRRATVHQDSDLESDGVKYRRRRVRRAQTAIGLADQVVLWPPAAKDLKGGFSFDWQPSEPHCNVHSANGGTGAATLVYLDEDPEQGQVVNTYKKLQVALENHQWSKRSGYVHSPQLHEALLRAHDRLCVVYREKHEYKVYAPPTFASITEPGGGSAVDIAGTPE